MGKRVIVVPPQAISVNVSVDVAQHSAPSPAHAAAAGAPAAAPQPTTQVDTAVTVSAAGWAPPAHPAAPAGPYSPPFSMPTSDVLRRKLPGLAPTPSSRLGDHVHSATCVEQGCALLSIDMPPARSAARPWASIGWVLVALVMWTLQYSVVLPLAYLGAVARSGVLQAIGWFAVLFCGLGPVLSLFYLCSPAVPRSALRPWGLAQVA